MCPRPPRSTRTDTPFPDPPLFRPQARQRRLAAAALADHRQGLATPHREADPIHRAHHPLLAEPGAAAAAVAADLSRLEDDVGRDGHDAAAAPDVSIGARSEERRVGKECVGTCRSWLSQQPLKQTYKI